MPAPLTVAIPADRAKHLRPGTGAGRVWHGAVPRLAARARVRTVPLRGDRPRRNLLRRSPDAWLIPGHEGPVETDEPVVAVVHGSAWACEPRFWDLCPRDYGERFIAMTETTLRSASCVIVPSEYTRRGFVDGYGMPEERIVAVHHGVDSDVFRPGVPGGPELVASALGHEAPYVVFVSIPTLAHKNLALLREAMDQLARAGLPHALAIVGGAEGAEQDQLAELTADLPSGRGRVAWLGQLDDGRLASVMAGADAFCLPSLIDSFGLTALEAMACGTPVVVSDRGGLPEVVGDGGLVCEPTVDAVREGLQRVLEDGELAERLGGAGRARAEQLTWDRTAEGWLSVLERAARAPWTDPVLAV